jgi:hypothetical protein
MTFEKFTKAVMTSGMESENEKAEKRALNFFAHWKPCKIKKGEE